MTASVVLGLITAAFSVIQYLTQLALEKKWMDAGAANVILQAMEESAYAIKQANAARERVASAPAEQLHDDDGFRRD